MELRRNRTKRRLGRPHQSETHVRDGWLLVAFHVVIRHIAAQRILQQAAFGSFVSMKLLRESLEPASKRVSTRGIACDGFNHLIDGSQQRLMVSGNRLKLTRSARTAAGGYAQAAIGLFL